MIQPNFRRIASQPAIGLPASANASSPGTSEIAPAASAGPSNVSLPEEMEMETASGLVSNAPIRILVVDDDELVRETFAAILSEEGYEVCCANSATHALDCLQSAEFDIMLCDIFMPGLNGLELLPKVLAAAPDMPVILVTGFGSVAMARDALRMGASDFITKPCNMGDLPIIVERNLTRQTVQRRRAQQHQKALETSNETVLDALLTALNTRDTETQGHSERVMAYTLEIADHLGLAEEDMYHIERGALLHDIGKIGVPDHILRKPGKLTAEEWIEMRRHPVIGYDMCARIEILREAASIVLHHHEAWDGSGYPRGLKGTAIPLGSRLFAIADTLDAMTSDRPYRAAVSFEAARQEIERFRSRQFDPGVVDIFLSIPETRWKHLRRQADA